MQRRILILFAIAALAFVLVACGSSSKNSSSNTPTTAAAASSGAASDTITIQNLKFTSITVKPGATVTVKNEDTTTHTSSADNGEWNTGNIDAGSSATFTAPTKPGSYKFHCTIHTFMTGTLTVAA
jgi:plastocyanin